MAFLLQYYTHKSAFLRFVKMVFGIDKIVSPAYCAPCKQVAAGINRGNNDHPLKLFSCVSVYG